jgi:hypothetical protein
VGALFSTPRPEPGHVMPALGGAIVLLIALPIFLVAGWPLEGWGLAAVLWAGLHALDLFLARTRRRTDTLGAPMQAFGLLFKLIVLLVVLFAAVAANKDVALAAALTYALAYTFELGLSLVGYFGAAKQ